MQLPSSQFTFVLDMALDCLFNNTGPAQNDDINLRITHYTLSVFIQSTKTLNRAYFWELFYFVHGLFLNILHGIIRLYKIAQECKSITTQQNKTTSRQRQMQMPIDQIILVPDLPTIQQEYSLQPHMTDPLDIPVSQKN